MPQDLTYDFMESFRFNDIFVDEGDLILQTGKFACIWQVRAARPEDDSTSGYMVDLVEEGGTSLTYDITRLRADGVSGVNGSPIDGIYHPNVLAILKDRVAEELSELADD
jgi:hypothetical protein